MPRTGTMRHQLEVENPTESRQPGGEFSKSFHPVATIFAELTPLSVRAQIVDQIRGVVGTHTIRTWFHDQIKEGTRFKLVGTTRYFYAISVLNKEEANVELEVLCEEKKQDATEVT